MTNKQKCSNCEFCDEACFRGKKQVYICALIANYHNFGKRIKQVNAEEGAETPKFCPLLKHSRKEIYDLMNNDRVS